MNKAAMLSIAVLIVSAFLTGCSDKLKIVDSDTYVFGQDSQENCIAYQSNAYLAESKESYYYLNKENQFVYVINKNNGVCMPLCNKSDCLHDKETDMVKRKTCNACLREIGYNIIYYNGSIYYAGSIQKRDKDGNLHFIEEIYKMSMDGSKRRSVYSTEKYTIWNFKIHRGYIYAEMTENGEDGAEWCDASLYKMSVSDTDDCRELLPYYKYKDKSMVVADTRFYGNHIFLMLYTLDDVNQLIVQFVRYDLKTDEYEVLNDKINQNDIYHFNIFNDMLVYGCDKGIFKCDFNGENNELMVDLYNGEYDGLDDYNYFHPLTNDGKYVIINASNENGISDKLILCDKDNNVKIKTFDFPVDITTGCDEVSMVMKSEDEKKLYFLDKSNGDVKVKEIYSFE